MENSPACAAVAIGVYGTSAAVSRHVAGRGAVCWTLVPWNPRCPFVTVIFVPGASRSMLSIETSENAPGDALLKALCATVQHDTCLMS